MEDEERREKYIEKLRHNVITQQVYQRIEITREMREAWYSIISNCNSVLEKMIRQGKLVTTATLSVLLGKANAQPTDTATTAVVFPIIILSLCLIGLFALFCAKRQTPIKRRIRKAPSVR